jgi:hypothetical protein
LRGELGVIVDAPAKSLAECDYSARCAVACVDRIRSSAACEENPRQHKKGRSSRRTFTTRNNAYRSVGVRRDSRR